MALTKEIKDMRDRRSKSGGNNEDGKENAPPNTAHGKRARQPYQRPKHFFEWVNGLKYDVTWTNAKKGWFRSEFKTRDHAGWKKWRIEELDRQRAALE